MWDPVHGYPSERPPGWSPDPKDVSRSIFVGGMASGMRSVKSSVSFRSVYPAAFSRTELGFKEFIDEVNEMAGEAGMEAGFDANHQIHDKDMGSFVTLRNFFIEEQGRTNPSQRNT